MVSCPLLTPLTFLWTRLPAVARLNARGPQGRLVLQCYTLDRSGAFRSGELPLCTGWPRTVMRGKPRKLTSGSDSVPKSARRTEPNPRNPRLAANAPLSGLKESLGNQEGKENLGCLSPLAPGRGHGLSAARRRQCPVCPSAATHLLRRQGQPSADSKKGSHTFTGICESL